MNPHCYLPSLIEQEPAVRRTVEMKVQIMEDLFGWSILQLDQDFFIEQGTKDKKTVYLCDLIGLSEAREELANQ